MGRELQGTVGLVAGLAGLSGLASIARERKTFRTCRTNRHIPKTCRKNQKFSTHPHGSQKQFKEREMDEHWSKFVPHGSFLNRLEIWVEVDTKTLGHVHSSSLRLWLASHHLTVFQSCPVETMTPQACCDTPAPAAALARSSHTASRNVRRC